MESGTRKETETLETKVVSPGLEGRRRGPLREVSMKVSKSKNPEGKAPGKEGEEIKSPKRTIIRVESEETHDYVREAKKRGSGGSGRIEFRIERGQVFRRSPLFSL